MFVIAKALVANEEGQILTIRRSKTDPRRPLQWDLPGGFVDDDEDLTEAVKREVQEEVGLAVTDLTLAYAMSEPTPDHGTGTWLFFITRVTGEPNVTISYEHDMYKWVTLDKLMSEITYDRQLKMLRFVKENKLLDVASS